MPYSAIDQGISNLYSSTVPGQTSGQVKQLQTALIAAGYNIPAGATGYYGAQTKAALDAWKTKLSQGGTQNTQTQTPQNITPSTPATATSGGSGMTTDQIKAIQDSLVAQGYMTQEEVNTGYGVFGPKTTAAYAKYQAAIKGAVANNPVTSTITTADSGSSADEIVNAYITGDWSNIKKSDGTPFSEADQRAAVDAATSALEPYYAGQAEKDKADTEAALAQKQLDYQKKLADDKVNFENDKTNLDQNSADNGVLFSGSRAQKQTALQNKYAAAGDYNRATTGNDISSLMRTYQNVQGSEAAKNLSEYFNLGGNTYDATVANGGVGSSGISSVYGPDAYNFGTGTAKTAKLSAIYSRAGNILSNKANKLASGGYNTQY